MKAFRGKIIKLIILANKAGFMHLLSANLLIQITGFGGQIFLTRILSVEDIGTIKVYQSILNILMIIASLGLNTAVLKLCSENLEQKERINIFNITLIFTLICSAIIVIISIIFYSDNLLKVYILLIPTLSITNLVVIYLQSQQKIKTISYIQSLSKIIIIIFSTLGAYLLGFHGYIYSLVLLNIVTFLFIVPFVRTELKFLNVTKFHRRQVKRVYSISIFAFGANLLGVLLINLNILIANFLSVNTKEIGFYSVAQLIVSTMMMIPSSLGQIMVPKLSGVSNDKNKITSYLRTYNIRNLYLAIFVVILAASLGPLLIPLFFGDKYSHSVPTFEILLIGFLFWSYYSPKGMTLLSIGRSDVNFYVSLISLMCNIIFNFVFIKSFGMVGAAVASTLTNFLTIFINNYFFNKVFFKEKNTA
ncbi:UNVERIFIED_ORG: O-antigen/teichoic acid export membrane protein [Bacillus sp. 1751]|nr:O-antigen/teichoic acid export membrane protein [Bacillus sp. 1751]